MCSDLGGTSKCCAFYSVVGFIFTVSFAQRYLGAIRVGAMREQKREREEASGMEHEIGTLLNTPHHTTIQKG